VLDFRERVSHRLVRYAKYRSATAGVNELVCLLFEIKEAGRPAETSWIVEIVGCSCSECFPCRLRIDPREGPTRLFVGRYRSKAGERSLTDSSRANGDSSVVC